MQIIDTTSHPSVFWPGVLAHMGLNYREKEHVFRRFARIRKSRKHEEMVVHHSGFGLVPRMHENEPFTIDATQEGPKIHVTHGHYALGFTVSKVAKADNLYPELAAFRVRELMRSAKETQELIGHLPLNRAFDPAVDYAGTGQPLISAAHGSLNGVTQSNRIAVAADISEASLESMVTQIRTTRNDRGLLISLHPKRLIYHVSQDFEVRRLLDATLQANTFSNNPNVLREGQFFRDRVASPYLLDQTAFFIQTDEGDGGVTFFERQPIETHEHTDDTTFATTTSIDFRVSCTSFDWRGIFGCPGS